MGEKTSQLPTVAVIEGRLDLKAVTFLTERAEGLTDRTGVGDKQVVILGCGKSLRIILADSDLRARRLPPDVNRLNPYRRSGRQNINADTGHAR